MVDFSASGKAQFLKELEDAMDSFVTSPAHPDEENITPPESLFTEGTIEDIVSDENSLPVPVAAETKPAETIEVKSQQEKMQVMENVMNHGMEFLSGMFKMATGNSLGLEGRKMEVDKETGEIVMRFKIPGM